MTHVEKTFFEKRFGENYFDYLAKHPKSLIARIYGVYTVKMDGQSTVHLMMLANTIRIHNKQDYDRQYDLKGSSVNRKIKVNYS